MRSKRKKPRTVTPFEAKWFSVCERWGSGGIGALSKPERVWLGVQMVQGAVGNGGLISYFYNHGANNIRNSLSALRAIGTPKARALLAEVAALFPGDSIKTLEGRNEVIDSWNNPGHNRRKVNRTLKKADKAFGELSEEIEEKLMEFLSRSGITS